MQDIPAVHAIVDYYLATLAMPYPEDIDETIGTAEQNDIEAEIREFLITNNLRPPYANAIIRYQITKLIIKKDIVGTLQQDLFKHAPEPDFIPSPQTKKFEAARHYRNKRNRKRQRIKRRNLPFGYTKRCAKCGQNKPAKEFYQNCPETIDGLSCRCRKCKAEQTKENRQNIKTDEIRQQQHREKERNRMREYRRNRRNKQEIKP